MKQVEEEKAMTSNDQPVTDAEQVTARDRIHMKVCRDDQCMIDTDQPGKDCKDLDYLLDVTEERALHQAAEKILGLCMYATLRHGWDAGSILAMAAKETDPYERREGGSLVRKSDGTPVPHIKD